MSKLPSAETKTEFLEWCYISRTILVSRTMVTLETSSSWKEKQFILSRINTYPRDRFAFLAWGAQPAPLAEGVQSFITNIGSCTESHWAKGHSTAKEVWHWVQDPLVISHIVPLSCLIEQWKSIVKAPAWIYQYKLWWWGTTFHDGLYNLDQWSLYGALSSIHRIPESRVWGIEIRVGPTTWLPVTCEVKFVFFYICFSQKQLFSPGNIKL